MRLPFWSLRQTLFWGTITSVLLYSTSAIAAEKVVLRQGAFRGTVSVSELTTFAETGEVSPALGFYLKAAQKDPQEVRQALTQEVKVNPLALDRGLNNPVGGILLDQASEVVHTPSGQADRQALRSALVLSAAQDGKITMIETIQNYPTSEVQVEGNRLKGLVQTYLRFSDLAGSIQDLLDSSKFF